MRVRATLKLRNARAIELRVQLGLSQVKTAKAIGVSQGALCALECLRFAVVSVIALKKISQFYNVAEEELVPPELRNQILRANFTITGSINSKRLLTHPAMMMLEDKNAPLLDEEMKTIIAEAVQHLEFRQQEIVRLRYGLANGMTHTLKECARILGTSLNNVHRQEGRALQELRRYHLQRFDPFDLRNQE